MNYSVNKLTTVAECDQVLAHANNEKRTLLFRKSNMTYSQENSSTTSDQVSAAIAVTQAELAGVVNILPTLPEGDVKEDYKRKQVKLENKLDDLGFRRQDVGAARLLIRELELGQIDAELAETDACIAAITARRAGL